MPTVPSYDRSIVQQSALPNARVSVDAPIEAFGGGQSVGSVTGALGNLANTFDKIAGEEKKKADDSIVTDRYATLLKEKNDMIYNPQTGALNKKGENAMGVITEYGDKFNNRARELEDSLNNEEQKQFFRKMVMREGAEFNGILNKHVAQESEVLSDNAFKSGIEATREDAILNYSEPGKIAQSIDQQKSLLMDRAQKKGLPVDSEQFQEISSKTHMGVLSRMINNGQDQLAEEYFKQTKKDYTSQDLVSVTKVLEEGSTLGQSQRLVQKLMGSGLNSQDAYKEINKIDNPKVQKAAKDLFRQEVSARENLLEADQKQLYNSVSEIIEKNESWQGVPLEQKLKLSISQRNSIDNRIEQLQKGIQPAANGEDYYNLKLMAANPTLRPDFSRKNLLEMKGKVTDPELHELINIQTSLEKGDGKADALLNGFRTDSEIVNTTLTQIGIDPTPKQGSTDAAKVNRFRQMVDEQVILHQQRSGKKATSQDVQSIADTLATKVVTDKGWIWNTRKFAFETNKPEFELEIGEVPRAERIKIEEALKNNNLPVTDKGIIELYSRKIKGLSGR